jgi:hypothetical protein
LTVVVARRKGLSFRRKELRIAQTRCVFRVGNGSVDVNVDLYNAFNSDAILQEVQNYGVAWRNATSVIQPRFVKFGARWDF